MTDVMTPEQRHRCMAAIRGRDTRPEMIVRRFLHARGLRYRLSDRRLPGTPDIVLKKYHTVIFIDGCFWHGHEGCSQFKLPKSNSDFWRHKINMNIARDYRANVELRLLGWRVIRVWECEIRKNPFKANASKHCTKASSIPVTQPTPRTPSPPSLPRPTSNHNLATDASP